MISIDEFESFIQNDIVYQQNLISIIDDLGKQIYLSNLGQLHSNYGKTIKLEGMEKYNEKIYSECLKLAKEYLHYGPVTCHIFRAFPDSKSFGPHRDLDDVLICVSEGQKTIYVDGVKKILNMGDRIFIKRDTLHEVINEKDSLILSFGLERFLVDKV